MITVMFPNRTIQCEICPRRCTLTEGQTGVCGVRKAQRTETDCTGASTSVELLSYAKTTGFAVDPIEKKPLNHFFPGTKTLSFGGIGCNLSCRFCQNASSAQSRNLSLLSDVSAAPEEVVQLARLYHCESVAFTYNEPIIAAEYVRDVATACRRADLKTVAVSNGFISDACRSAFFGVMDAANIDLKSFSPLFYRKYCGGEVEPVKETLRYLAQSSTWLEVTTLLIPTLNDSVEEIDELCSWFAKELGKEVPLHFSAFHPANKLLDIPAAPPQTLFRSRETALSKGLRYVYTGNIADTSGQSTHCPQCGQTVIFRNRYVVEEYNIDEESCCRYCGVTIAGRFQDD